MTMKKTLAGLMAGIVAVSAMATSAFAADEPFTIELGGSYTKTTYNYDVTVNGAYVLPVKNDIIIRIGKLDGAANGGWVNNNNDNKVTITVNGYDKDGKSTSATITTGEAGWNWGDDHAHIVFDVTDNKYGSGLNVSNFETAGSDGVIVTSIAVNGISVINYEVNYAATDDKAKTWITIEDMKQYNPQGGTDYTLGGSLRQEGNAPKSSADASSPNGVDAGATANITLKNSQKRILREGATATLTITFDKVGEKESKYLTYKIGDVEYPLIAGPNTDSYTTDIPASDLYKAAANEDDVESYISSFTNTSAVKFNTVKIVVTPAASEPTPDDDNSSTPDDDDSSTPDDSTTTPDDGEENPPMGSAPVALAVIPVALAAAVVVAKKRA